ncbi:hypothetical protein HO932_05315 [Streptococcus suis]|nr:hypothetical protein [Streptococcus suis]NQN95518.1 hypothetical protein [Streptococcus suis]NQO34595.1 hypothetical protein [Streptococcus suis]NQO44692.1 hypothetical protein [Streptococcus suis]NQO55350.1 hypothetical protein [Streptococcus suis]
MANIRFKLNRSGVRELMKSSEMQSILTETANEVVNRAGDGYEQDIYVGKSRANAMVSAKTYQAKKDNLNNNTLLKVLNA